MKIYRRIVPKIAKDVVRSLLANRAIEIEDGKRDEAEVDVAAVFVEYLNAMDQIRADAQDTLQRQKLPIEMMPRVKELVAKSRKIPLQSDEALGYLVEKIIVGLFESKHIEEIFAEDNDLTLFVRSAVEKYLGVDEELDREVRGRLKNLREGTVEWEAEYGRLIGQMRAYKAG